MAPRVVESLYTCVCTYVPARVWHRRRGSGPRSGHRPLPTHTSESPPVAQVARLQVSGLWQVYGLWKVQYWLGRLAATRLSRVGETASTLDGLPRSHSLGLSPTKNKDSSHQSVKSSFESNSSPTVDFWKQKLLWSYFLRQIFARFLCCCQEQLNRPISSLE